MELLSEQEASAVLPGRALGCLTAMAQLGIGLDIALSRDLVCFQALLDQLESTPGLGEGDVLCREDLEFLAGYGALFDREYFESGTISGYRNYNWSHYDPEITRPRVEAIERALRLTGSQRILDFGCALGFYVWEFQSKGYDAIGLDISTFALEQSSPSVRARLRALDRPALSELIQAPADVVLVKDVLEHVPERILARVWRTIRLLGRIIVVTVPIASRGNSYDNETDNHDATHLVRRTRGWWLDVLGPDARPHRELCTHLKERQAEGSLCALVHPAVERA